MNSIPSGLQQQEVLFEEAPFDPNALPSGMSCKQLAIDGRALSSYLVKFEDAFTLLGTGIPILPDGVLMAGVFGLRSYPKTYLDLFSDTFEHALDRLRKDGTTLRDIYVTLTGEPYYHWLLDTVPHLYGASCLGRLRSIKITVATKTLKSWQIDLLRRSAAAFGVENLNIITMAGQGGNLGRIRPGYSQTPMRMADRLTLLRRLHPTAFRGYLRDSKP